MNWLKRFLGLYDKKQKERTQEVADYVHDKKQDFTSTMVKAHREAKKEHQKAGKLKESSARIEERIIDVTQAIYLVTGHR